MTYDCFNLIPGVAYSRGFDLRDKHDREELAFIHYMMMAQGVLRELSRASPTNLDFADRRYIGSIEPLGQLELFVIRTPENKQVVVPMLSGAH